MQFAGPDEKDVIFLKRIFFSLNLHMYAIFLGKNNLAKGMPMQRKCGGSTDSGSVDEVVVVKVWILQKIHYDS